MTRKKRDHRKVKCIAALKAIAARGEKDMTPAQIALLPEIMAFVDNEAGLAFRKSLPQGEPHERLFEILMARFDVLQTYRTAFLNIIDAIRKNPSLASYILPTQCERMQKNLALAGLKETGIKNILAITGLLGIYVWTLHVWEGDESEDMTRTMAALDRHLRHANKLADILFHAI